MLADKFKTIKLTAFVLFGFLFIVLLYEIVLSQHFRVVSTNPDTGKVATVSPFFKINFNKSLSKNGVSVSSSYSVIKSFSVEDKTLDISLNTPMTAGYGYYVKISSVSDIKGHKITNKVFKFTPRYISPQNLPSDQAAAILKTQSQKPRSVNTVTFANTDIFLNYGMSLEQLDNLKQDFFLFNDRVSDVFVDKSSVSPVPHNPSSATLGDTINFSVKIDSKTYKARVDYFNLSQARLYLYDTSFGTQVFDSANTGLRE